MRFIEWLIKEEEEAFNKWKHIIISYLNLDSQKGLSQNLDMFDKTTLVQKLKDLNEFAEFDSNKQSLVIGYIQSPIAGTIGDLIRKLAD